MRVVDPNTLEGEQGKLVRPEDDVQDRLAIHRDPVIRALKGVTDRVVAGGHQIPCPRLDPLVTACNARVASNACRGEAEASGVQDIASTASDTIGRPPVANAPLADFARGLPCNARVVKDKGALPLEGGLEARPLVGLAALDKARVLIAWVLLKFGREGLLNTLEVGQIKGTQLDAEFHNRLLLGRQNAQSDPVRKLALVGCLGAEGHHLTGLFLRQGCSRL